MPKGFRRTVAAFKCEASIPKDRSTSISPFAAQAQQKRTSVEEGKKSEYWEQDELAKGRLGKRGLQKMLDTKTEQK